MIMAKNSITKLVTESQLEQLELACDDNFAHMPPEVFRLVLAVVSDFILATETGMAITPQKTDRIKVSSNVIYGDFKHKLASKN
jgi:hypothetical protein